MPRKFETIEGWNSLDYEISKLGLFFKGFVSYEELHSMPIFELFDLIEDANKISKQSES